MAVIRLVVVGDVAAGGPTAESHPDGSVTYVYGTFPDGTPRRSSGAMEAIVRTHMLEYDLSEAAAVDWLDEHGWTNGYTLAILPRKAAA